MSKVTIQYRPLKWAMEHLHNRKERFIVIVAGRGSGKTIASVNQLIRSAMTDPGVYAYIAPFENQAKRVVWDLFKQYSKDLSPKYDGLSIAYPSGGKVFVLGADNPEAMRGLHMKGFVIDEVADIKKTVVSKVLLPTITKHNGYAIYIGTPKGKNLFYDLYKRGQDNKADWYSVKLTAYEAKNLTLWDINKIKEEMTDEQFSQEYMCDFDTAVNGAIYGAELTWLKTEKRITRVIYDPTYPVYTFWDIGYSDKTAIIWVQKVGNAYYLIDCFEDNGKTVEYYANIIKSRGYNIDTNYLPHDASHKTLSNNGISFKEQLEKLGLNCEIVPAPNSKMVAINATRMRLKLCFIDENKCEKLIEYLARYQWKATGNQDKIPQHDDTSHMMDSLSYLAMTELYGKLNRATSVTIAPQFYNPESESSFDIRF